MEESTAGLEADPWALARVKDWPKWTNRTEGEREEEPGSGGQRAKEGVVSSVHNYRERGHGTQVR